MGPRRVGKTVMIHHSIQRLIEAGISPMNICYVSVDHPIYNALSLEQFLEHFKAATGVDYRKTECFVFFDEIQYLKNWEAHLKSLVDNYPNVKCTVSGSAAAALRLKSSESGAGRFTDFLLPPLTFHEYMVLLNLTDLVQVDDVARRQRYRCRDIGELNRHFINYLNYGGYPEVVFSEEIQKDPGRFVKNDIIDKVLLRDLPGLYGIQDIQELNYLFTTLAYNTANEISLEELSKNSGVAKNTIKRYIEYLEAAFLVRMVHRVDRNARRFRRANFFKIYLTNPSIRAALFTPVIPPDDVMGSLVETAIFAQWFHSNSMLYYARWGKGEVDIVHLNEKQKAAWAVEAKWTDRFYDHPGELKSLLSFCRAQDMRRAMVTTETVTGSRMVKDVTLDYTPASVYCYILGLNIVRGKSASEVIAQASAAE
jgi:predicted AAA+ superfamily ATPase